MSRLVLDREFDVQGVIEALKPFFPACTYSRMLFIRTIDDDGRLLDFCIQDSPGRDTMMAYVVEPSEEEGD